MNGAHTSETSRRMLRRDERATCQPGSNPAGVTCHPSSRCRRQRGFWGREPVVDIHGSLFMISIIPARAGLGHRFRQFLLAH